VNSEQEAVDEPAGDLPIGAEKDRAFEVHDDLTGTGRFTIAISRFLALSTLNRFGFSPEFSLPIQAVSSFLLGNIGDVYRFLRWGVSEFF